MAIQDFPYRRELRPSLMESLGEHTDREYQKIEAAFALLQQRLALLETPPSNDVMLAALWSAVGQYTGPLSVTSLDRLLTGLLSGGATYAASMVLTRPLSGSVAGAATFTGSFAIAGLIALSGSLLGSASLTATMTLSRLLSGTALGAGSATGTLSITSGGGYSAEAIAYFTAMTVEPDDTRKALINTLIVDLKADFVWDKLDWFLILAGHNEQASQVNAANPAKSATPVNTPVFTASRGYAGDGLSKHLHLGETYPAGTKYVQDSAHIGVWTNQQSGTASQSHFGTDGSGADNRAYSVIPGTATGNETFRINDATNSTMRAADGNRLGYRLLVREGPTTKRAYFNATQVADLPTPSTGTPTGTATILRRAAVHSDDRVALFHSGSALTPTQAAAAHTRISAFLSAIGAN